MEKAKRPRHHRPNACKKRPTRVRTVETARKFETCRKLTSHTNEDRQDTRTGPISLQQKGPGIESPSWSCGGFNQTAVHILQFCAHFNEARPELFRSTGTNDTRVMLSTPKCLKAATKWMMQTNLLKQFSLAREQLYGETVVEEVDDEREEPDG